MFGKIFTYHRPHILARTISLKQREDLQYIINKHKFEENWDAIRYDILQTSKQINPLNIDAVLLDSCIFEKNFQLGMSYINYLNSRKNPLNLAVKSKMLRIYAEVFRNNLTDESEKKILDLYNDVKSEYKVLDVMTSENAIKALSLTKQWKECLTNINEMKITSNPSQQSYNSVIIAAFKNKEYETGWRLLTEMIANNRMPCEKIYQAYIETVKQFERSHFLKRMHKLFQFFSVHDIMPTGDTIRMLMTTMIENYKMHTKFNPVVSIYHDGVCSHCDLQLDTCKVSLTDFTKMRNAFLNRVLIGKDIFRNSTPVEYEKFKAFLNNQTKYDVVIDGLNVAYSAGTKLGIHHQASMLAAVVKYFVQKGKKVLVLGRAHMHRWPSKHMSYITYNADTFFADDISEDDPFLLYCALNSGYDTIVVTRDMMRNHLYLLKDVDHKRTFNRWFSQAQYYLSHIDQRGRVIFRYPLPYYQSAQQSGEHWHIPYQDNKADAIKWLCIKM